MRLFSTHPREVFTLHKTRIAMMEDALDDHGLDLALAERRAEAALEEAPAG